MKTVDDIFSFLLNKYVITLNLNVATRSEKEKGGCGFEHFGDKEVQ